MTNEPNMYHALRRTRRTLFVVVALYVALGLVVSGAGALTGDRLSAFLGFLIVGGALAAATTLSVLFRAVFRTVTLDDSIGEVKSSVARIEKTLSRPPLSTGEDADRVRVLNLASVGGGDPSAITAATLDRSVFPRLVTTMGDEEVLASLGIHVAPPAAIESPDPEDAASSSPRSSTSPKVAVKDLWRVWGAAMRAGDLPTCQTVYAALVDVADAEAVADMAEALKALATRHEHRLRTAFGKHVQLADYAEALRIGGQICRMFPEHPLSDEFRRLKPILERRASEAPESESNRRHVASP